MFSNKFKKEKCRQKPEYLSTRSFYINSYYTENRHKIHGKDIV